MDTISLENYLASLQQLAKRYFRQIGEAADEHWDCEPGKESIEVAGAKASGGCEARDHLNSRLNAICDIYLTTTDTERGELRSALSRFPILLNTLGHYIDWCQSQIKTSEDRVRLRRALAAASLADNRLGYKELYLSLGRLYEASTKAGLHPSTEFLNVGRLSNPEHGKAEISMRDFLMDFENSAFFRYSVQPRL